MRLHSLLNSFTAVGAGQTASARPSTKRNYHGLFLFSNAASAVELNYQVREVRLKVGALTLIKLTIPQLYALLAYRGLPVGTGEIPFYFSRPESRTPTGEELTGFNTFNIDEMTLEVEFRSNAEYNALKSIDAGTAITSGFVPTLSGLAEYDYNQTGNRSFIQTVDTLIPNSGAGDVDYDTLVREGAYKAVHIFSGLVNRCRVFRDQLELMDRNTAQIDAINRRYGLTRQANHFPIDFGFTNQAMDVLEMSYAAPGGGRVAVNTFNLKLTTTGAGSLPAVVERVITV